MPDPALGWGYISEQKGQNHIPLWSVPFSGERHKINYVCEYDEQCQGENRAEKGAGEYRVR